MGKGNRFDAAMGVLERYGGKLQSMTYLVAIKDAFTDLMPIITDQQRRLQHQQRAGPVCGI